jgi:endonuclease/exonuclease/phosphatase family metal-dependent hydrolase
MDIRAITWNVFHGRDAPPNGALRTLRSQLFRITERNATHVQVNRNLYDQYASVIATAQWDMFLLQEFPPRWAERLARDCGAQAHLVLTSRNSFAPLRTLVALLNPDLIGSNEGGSNLILVRGDTIADRRELVIREHKPERRAMAFTRLGSGLCVANLHASNAPPPLPDEELRLAADCATRWAGDDPLILGGDFNMRPDRVPELFEELEQHHGLRPPTAPDTIDHLLARGLEIIEPPRKWPPEAHELPWDGLRLRLSDHAPVEALFRTP